MANNISDIISWIRTGFTLFVVTAAVLAAGCGRDDVVKKGSKVKVKYEGILADSSVFDKSEPGRPLEFTAGKDEVIPGFDKAVLGMKLHEKKEFTIPPEEGYGLRNETWFRKVPPSFFPDNVTPRLNMTISLQDERGTPYLGTITEITEDSLTLDLNHPLAGKQLTFKVEIVGIEQPVK